MQGKRTGVGAGHGHENDHEHDHGEAVVEEGFAGYEHLQVLVGPRSDA